MKLLLTSLSPRPAGMPFCLQFWAVPLVALGLTWDVPGAAVADSFSVSRWNLFVSVDDFSTSEHSSAGSDTVQNPFQDSHTALLPGKGGAAAQYDISWVMDFASFSITSQLAAQDGHSVRSQASGVIYLQSNVDLAFSVDALLNYDLPTWGLLTYLSVTARDLTTDKFVYSELRDWSTSVDPVGPGTLSFTGNFVLPAGHQYRLYYGMGLHTFGDSTGLATGDGHVNFTLTPEPTTLALLAPLLLTLRRRRRLASLPGSNAVE